ncbi:MAG: hypothetical protein O2838_00970 [Proteobacteria bacterium]|nr:hypothetical protein [Pseudomonadota bacterium]
MLKIYSVKIRLYGIGAPEAVHACDKVEALVARNYWHAKAEFLTRRCRLRPHRGRMC